MDIEKTVWNFLRGKGLSEKVAAAVMGNIYAESGFNESAIEKGNGIGFGLCQWSYDRRKQLEKFGTSLTHQLNFLWAELSGSIGNTRANKQWDDKIKGYLSHDNFMNGNGSIQELTKAFCFKWERPNASVAHLDTRQKKAEEYFEKYTGTIGDVDIGDGSAMTIEATNYEVVKDSDKEGEILFGRRCRITIADEDNNALDVSKLRCTFNIVKTIQMEPNISIIEIYNLAIKTENDIITNGKRVTIEAGYEGTQFGLIFDGDILQCINSRDDGTTCKLTIIALDSDRAINFELANFSIVRGQTQRSIIEHMTNVASNPIPLGSISEQLDNTQLARGKVFFGKMSDYCRQIAKGNELQFYMDDGTLNLISMKDLPEGEIIDISPESGLVGTPEQSDYGVTGKCLLNPQIKLNSLIHIDNSLVRAKQIDINGSNATPAGATEISVTGTREKIIAEAKKICDDPKVEYSQPNRGKTVGGITYWDCSSFVKHCYEVAGLSIVDITEPQYNQVVKEGKIISQSEAQAGDIVFWFKGNECNHVAIYDGNGHCYAARGRDGKAPADQVAYHELYGSPKFGRPKCLIEADGGTVPSCSSNTDSTEESQGLFRALDKDGIYRVIKMTYQGDTRGTDWYIDFETIDQLGGAIAVVSS